MYFCTFVVFLNVFFSVTCVEFIPGWLQKLFTGSVNSFSFGKLLWVWTNMSSSGWTSDLFSCWKTVKHVTCRGTQKQLVQVCSGSSPQSKDKPLWLPEYIHLNLRIRGRLSATWRVLRQLGMAPPPVTLVEKQDQLMDVVIGILWRCSTLLHLIMRCYCDRSLCIYRPRRIRQMCRHSKRCPCTAAPHYSGEKGQ